MEVFFIMPKILITNDDDKGLWSNLSNNSNSLMIGNESTPSSGASFGGWITNFRWVKGHALYTSNFTIPLTNLTVSNGNNTKLLLLALNNASVTVDSSDHTRTSTASNITWQAFNSTMS